MKHLRLALFGLAVSSTLIASNAFAEEASSGTGVQVGLRLGYALPMGESVKDSKMSDGLKSAIPIQVDVGYRVIPALVIGGFFSYAPLQLKDGDQGCPSGADCSNSQLRFGVQAHYHLMPTEKFDPWLGAGIGYELVNSKATKGSVESSFSYGGFEFLNLQAGADYKVMPKLGIGPYLSFALGQYSKSSAKLSGTGVADYDRSADIDSDKKAMHQWLTISVRGAFDL